MMTTYFPSILLTAITFATTLFKPFFFEAALSANLTTMLVMTTIFISKMESLPPTSDIKMIDIWLVLCQMVPFAEVVLLTAMEYHRRDDSHGQNCNMIVEMNDEGIEGDEPKEKCYQQFWVPQLATIGDIPDVFYTYQAKGKVHKKTENFSLGQTPTHPPFKTIVFLFFDSRFTKKSKYLYLQEKKKKKLKKLHFRQTPTHPKLFS